MGFFRKEQLPKMSPLVDLPKAGEPIVFDEEEQQVIDDNIKRQFGYLERDTGEIFEGKVAEALSAGFAADALRYIVNQRIGRGELKGAASTCMKLFGIALEILPSDYLTLAKIFALHGDAIRANSFVSAANETHKKLGFDKMGEYSNKGWKIRVQEVENIIKSKGSKHK